jgi:hypothetical protein
VCCVGFAGVVDCDSLVLNAKVSRGYTLVSLYCTITVRWPFKSIYTGSDCDASLLRLAFLHARIQLERNIDNTEKTRFNLYYSCMHLVLRWKRRVQNASHTKLQIE